MICRNWRKAADLHGAAEPYPFAGGLFGKIKAAYIAPPIAILRSLPWKAVIGTSIPIF
jgi:hypothetical protein